MVTGAARVALAVLVEARPDLAMPCLATWQPRTCRSRATSAAARWRSPIDHACWLPRLAPHVCVCARCGWWGRVASGSSVDRFRARLLRAAKGRWMQ